MVPLFNLTSESVCLLESVLSVGLGSLLLLFLFLCGNYYFHVKMYFLQDQTDRTFFLLHFEEKLNFHSQRYKNRIELFLQKVFEKLINEDFP